MQVTLWMSTSLNGFIARPNNEEDFISHDSWLEWIKYIKQIGCIIWGRKTYEIVKAWDKAYLNDLKGIKVIIVSTDGAFKVEEGFEQADSPQVALDLLTKQGFTHAVLTGCATLNTSFAKLGLINEVIVNLEPVIIGAGIPLFSPEIFDLRLTLIDTRQINHLTQLHYRAIKSK